MTDTHFDTSKAGRLDNEARIKELRIPELLREVGKIKGGTVAVDLGRRHWHLFFTAGSFTRYQR